MPKSPGTNSNPLLISWSDTSFSPTVMQEFASLLQIKTFLLQEYWSHMQIYTPNMQEYASRWQTSWVDLHVSFAEKHVSFADILGRYIRLFCRNTRLFGRNLGQIYTSLHWQSRARSANKAQTNATSVYVSITDAQISFAGHMSLLHMYTSLLQICTYLLANMYVSSFAIEGKTRN